MKTSSVFFIILFIVSFCPAQHAQSIDKITRRCLTPNQNTFASVSIVHNDIVYTPCPNGVSSVTGITKLVSSSYTNGLFPNMPFSIAQSGNRTLTGGFSAIALDNTIVSNSGSGNYFVGEYNNLAIGGTTATHANIFGNLIAVSNRATSTLLGGTDTIEGVDVFTNIETPTTTGYGFFAFASTGSADAVGTGTVSAINGTAGMHNASYTGSLNAIEGRIFTSISTVGAVTNPLTRNIWLHGTNNANNILTDWRGISIDSFTNLGTVGTTYAIYIDSSLNGLGVTKNYALYSLSVAPSRLTGDMYISDFNKGIILTSPDGSCYRYTAANGGALNAGVLVTCP